MLELESSTPQKFSRHVVVKVRSTHNSPGIGFPAGASCNTSSSEVNIAGTASTAPKLSCTHTGGGSHCMVLLHPHQLQLCICPDSVLKAHEQPHVA